MPLGRADRLAAISGLKRFGNAENTAEVYGLLPSIPDDLLLIWQRVRNRSFPAAAVALARMCSHSASASIPKSGCTVVPGCFFLMARPNNRGWYRHIGGV